MAVNNPFHLWKYVTKIITIVYLAKWKDFGVTPQSFTNFGDPANSSSTTSDLSSFKLFAITLSKNFFVQYSNSSSNLPPKTDVSTYMVFINTIYTNHFVQAIMLNSWCETGDGGRETGCALTQINACVWRINKSNNSFPIHKHNLRKPLCNRSSSRIALNEKKPNYSSDRLKRSDEFLFRESPRCDAHLFATRTKNEPREAKSFSRPACPDWNTSGIVLHRGTKVDAKQAGMGIMLRVRELLQCYVFVSPLSRFFRLFQPIHLQSIPFHIVSKLWPEHFLQLPRHCQNQQ